MYLCIAEKPNVAEHIADALGAKTKNEYYYEGNGYYVTWCVGHLIALSYPDAYDSRYKSWDLATLPFIPTEYKLEVIKSTEMQFNAIRDLMHREDVTMIIDCGDAGREGCNIQNLVRVYAKCDKPVKRLWISSLTEKSILDGFENLRNIHDYDNMTMAAWARMRKDYVVGINATRAVTAKYGNNTVMNCGMAQTPTLGLIVAQANKVEEYVAENYYTIDVCLDDDIHVKYLPEEGEKISFSEAKVIEGGLLGKAVKVEGIEEKKKKVERPQLYDLTTLQCEANSKYQYSAKEVLNICQELYERRLITYPRTSSRYLPEEMKSDYIRILQIIGEIEEYKDLSVFFCENGTVLDQRIFDDGRLSDHHAIIVTDEISEQQIRNLSDKQLDILHMIIRRMYIVVCESYIYQETKILFSAEDIFLGTNVNTPIRLGWKWLDAQFSGKELKKTEQGALQNINVGDCIAVVDVQIEEKTKAEPKYYTESSLLYAMENIHKFFPDPIMRKKVKGHGIGTEATRADIIEGLIEHGYVKRERKNKVIYLLPTQKGINLISIMPEELVSYTLSAEWEMMLDEIENGAMDEEEFMNIVYDYTTELISTIKNSDYKVAFCDDLPVGTCPRCGMDVYERGKKGKKLYACENKECNFAIFKEDKSFMNKTKTPLKTGQVKLLLAGKTFAADCISSKNNEKYRALFYLKDQGTYTSVQIKEFVNRKR